MQQDVHRSVAYLMPIYNEAGNLRLLYETLLDVTRNLQDRYEFEFVFVNDGSVDESLELLVALRSKDPRVTVLSFSRNYGHQLAVTAGLDHTEADAVIIMDADMQDPPSVSIELLERWEAGADVVYAQRRSRKDGIFKRASAHSFYWLLNKLAAIEIPRNTGDFRLLDRRVVLELRKYGEHHRFLRGLVSYVGFRQEAVFFDREARYAGSTGYPLHRMVSFAMDGVLGFSTAPLKFIGRLGAAMSALAFAGIIYVVVVRLFAPSTAVPGWAFVTVAMFLLGGIQLIMLGVLGSYIGRTYIEVQRRPLYTISLHLSGSSFPNTKLEGRGDES